MQTETTAAFGERAFLMRILSVSNYYFPHIGGIEQVARDCVNALQGQYEQRVICFNHKRNNETGCVDGVEIVRAGCFAKIASQSLSFGYRKLLKRQFAEFRPDIVIFHYPNPFVAHYLLKLLKKQPAVKLVLYWHLDITKQKILGKFFRGQTRRLLERASKIVATSPNYIAGSRDLSAYREKCEVIPNCVNDGRVALSPSVTEQAARIRESCNGKIVVFALGRHVPYKGMEHLVRASKLLPDKYRVFIGGTGPKTSSLKKSARGDEKLSFLGKIDDDARKAYMLACDIYCFPSVTKNEAFGLALAEAMSFGKPAVTFTIAGSGVNYVSVANETGCEVPNGDDAAFARAIETLGDDGALRKKYGDAARERAKLLCSQTAFSGRVRKLIGLVCEAVSSAERK